MFDIHISFNLVIANIIIDITWEHGLTLFYDETTGSAKLADGPD